MWIKYGKSFSHIQFLPTHSNTYTHSEQIKEQQRKTKNVLLISESKWVVCVKNRLGRLKAGNTKKFIGIKKKISRKITNTVKRGKCQGTEGLKCGNEMVNNQFKKQQQAILQQLNYKRAIATSITQSTTTRTELMQKFKLKAFILL